LYHARGYYGKDLDDYVIWTKVYNDFPDLMARYKNGWITLEDVKHQLVDVDRMPEDRFYELLETKIKAFTEERVAETTALTRSLIIKGAKEDKLTYEQTIELLMRKNYDRWEAEYIYDIEVGAASSPETPLEFRKLVESYRKSQGLDYKEIPPEVIEAERVLTDLETRHKALEAAKAPQEDIDRIQADIAVARAMFESLKTAVEL
ncbi:unnamed protein product, partial [marine sediment metagenome]